VDGAVDAGKRRSEMAMKYELIEMKGDAKWSGIDGVLYLCFLQGLSSGSSGSSFRVFLHWNAEVRDGGRPG